jgi:hypothetical protein
MEITEQTFHSYYRTCNERSRSIYVMRTAHLNKGGDKREDELYTNMEGMACIDT